MQLGDSLPSDMTSLASKYLNSFSRKACLQTLREQPIIRCIILTARCVISDSTSSPSVLLYD